MSVLKLINLEVRFGEQIAIVGSSGSGKSTLLHLLSGLDAPTAGSIHINGKNIAELDEKSRGQLRNRSLGFVYQFHHLLPEFTAIENVMLPLLIRRLPTSEAGKNAAELLSQVGLGHRMNHKPAELSGGERQRVAIARALITKPLCLLADEPTGNVDRENARAIQDLILQLNQELKISTIIATHDLDLASSLNRVFRLDNGNLQEYTGT